MLNAAFTRIGLSPIVEISERIRDVAPRWEAKTGAKFAYLQRGELADNTPAYITRAMEQAVAAGLTRYPKSGGEPWFKDAVLARMAENGLTGLGREHVICTYGGQEGLQLVFNMFAGGRVVSFAPTWSCVLDNIAPYAGCTLDEVALVERDGRLDIDFAQVEAKLPGAALLYVNSPQNPTGKVFSREELSRLNDLCVKHGVHIVSDEAYEDFVFGGAKHVSMLQFPGDHIFGVFTCSKSYAATGFRIGYTVCRNAGIIAKLTLGEYTQTGGVVPFIQKAFVEAMTNEAERQAWLEPLLAKFARRRELIVEKLGPVLGPGLYRPEGAFYFFLNLKGLVPEAPAGQSQGEFTLQRFLDAGVAVIPGTAFGGAEYAHHVRISFSGIEEAELAKALDRITSQVFTGTKRASA
ncbi:MAG: pyridoxal phosphate-dependent aminotransferase [bacterium]|nr:pyridoxal phosphate-dependent aminotransferase [bacterium]MBK7672868.1 pyridoxal phosphate-dependent aminotransferase [bacterium]